MFSNYITRRRNFKTCLHPIRTSDSKRGCSLSCTLKWTGCTQGAYGNPQNSLPSFEATTTCVFFHFSVMTDQVTVQKCARMPGGKTERQRMIKDFVYKGNTWTTTKNSPKQKTCFDKSPQLNPGHCWAL